MTTPSTPPTRPVHTPDPAVDRRRYLALLATAAGGVLAGCLTDDDPDPAPTPTATPTTPTDPPGDDPTAGPHGPTSTVQWHAITLTFEGPDTGEEADPNPFLDYRLDVTFDGPNGERFVVPGYYAADGEAADTDATSGNRWRVHFAPPTVGQWRYRASFRTGSGVAVDGLLTAGSGAATLERPSGTPTAFDGTSGRFDVEPVPSVTADLRTRGRLAYVGEHYLRFLGTGDYFLKTGANSPENVLAYHEFSGTYDTDGSFLHRFEPHVDDWRPGDPTWGDGRGKGIVGAVNYLAAQGVNAHYLLTYTVDGGDGGDVWPWTSPAEKTRFDVSKLDQWGVVFDHMTRRGLQIHLVFQEEENDRALDGGDVGVERALYARELVARVAHHPAVVWNLGEETTLDPSQVAAFARVVRALDPYDHPTVVHSRKTEVQQAQIFAPLLGDEALDGPSIQAQYDVHSDVVRWREESAAAGRPWVVNADELGDHRCGIPEDGGSCRGAGQVDVLHDALYGSLLGGAAGVEWYFGYQTVGGDLELEDYRTREQWWAYNRHARTLLESLPFWEMAPVTGVVDGVSGYALATPGSVYVLSLASGDGAVLTLAPGEYTGRWYDPRSGAFVGTDFAVTGGGAHTLESPPVDGHVVLLLTATE